MPKNTDKNTMNPYNKQSMQTWLLHPYVCKYVGVYKKEVKKASIQEVIRYSMMCVRNEKNDKKH